MENSKAALKKRMLATPVVRKQNISASSLSNAPPPPSVSSSDSKKRKLPPALAPTPTYALSDVATNTKVYTIINTLKERDGNGEPPLTEKEIMRLTAINVTSTPGLADLLRHNPKIIWNPTNKTYQYRPKYTIRSKEDLVALVKEHRFEGGMEVKELLDSWNNVIPVIQELEKSGDLFALKTKDGKPRIVFYNDKELNVTMSSEFHKYWHEVQLPKETDLAKELERAGLKSMEVFSTMDKDANKPKGKRRRQTKRIKLTNTHLEGLDILGAL
ncbi:hypothetical protein DFS34DRAFT_151797 [Phlyctochytrium arcticum]|nr:hypothetical protein DFS34DRAFT_151797 [Phlyctochytrium arcticum]